MKGTTLCIVFFFALALPFTHGKAYCTYHLYSSGDSINSVACSDGANGISTRFGYFDLSPMYPYVTAFSGATWNSPNCGKCIQVTSNSGKSVFLTVIDQCGLPPGGYDAHFDIAPPAFRELFGDAGVTAGVQDAINWQVVDGANCRGNKGGSARPPSNPNPVPNPPSNPNPVPNPVPSGSSKNRCGENWSAANSNPCNTPCVFDDSPCPPNQHCFANLAELPCSPRAVGEFVDENMAEQDLDSAVAEENFEGVEENMEEAVEENFDAAVEENFDAAVEENFDAAVEENFDDSNVDAAVEENVDAAVENVDATVVNVDAAFAGEVETSFEQNFDALVQENLDSAFVEKVEANQAADSTNTGASSSGMEGWLVGIMVLFSVCAVLLVSVIALVLVYLRK